MEITVSRSNDPFFNLAAEERLLAERSGEMLLLYINSPSVIVGRNQSPEAEADLEFCASKGIPVIKRISGGGAVYHDCGNINYSFITDKGDKSVLDGDFLYPVAETLRKLGIDAVAGKRKELLLGDKKISGTAAHVKKERQMFHGTLLYDTDLDILEKALRGDRSKRGKRVASVSSPVINIKGSTGENLSTKEFFAKLVSAFMEYYGVKETNGIG